MVVNVIFIYIGDSKMSKIKRISNNELEIGKCYKESVKGKIFTVIANGSYLFNNEKYHTGNAVHDSDYTKGIVEWEFVPDSYSEKDYMEKWFPCISDEVEELI